MRRNRKKISRDELYRRYKRDYKLAARRMERVQHRVMDSEMMDKDDFFRVYESTKGDLDEYSKNIDKDKPTQQEVIDFIVSDQRYEMTKAQAKALEMSLSMRIGVEKTEKGKYYKDEQGRTIFPESIRRGTFADEIGTTWDEIRRERARMAEEGYTKEQMEDEIAHTYFGSPKGKQRRKIRG